MTAAKFVFLAIIGLTMLSYAQTPADIVRNSKMTTPAALDLRNTDPSVFNSSAFSNSDVFVEHYNSTPKTDQNDVGIPNSTLSFLQSEPNYIWQNTTKKVANNPNIIH
jgi:hypothetical protein